MIDSLIFYGNTFGDWPGLESRGNVPFNILGVGRSGRSSLDLPHHLRAASRTFIARNTLSGRKVRVNEGLRFFDCAATPFATFGVRHGALYQSDVCHTNVVSRKNCFMTTNSTNGQVE